MSYKIYNTLAYVAFYGVDYLKDPMKIFRSISNIRNKNINSEIERKLAFRGKKTKLEPKYS